MWNLPPDNGVSRAMSFGLSGIDTVLEKKGQRKPRPLRCEGINLQRGTAEDSPGRTLCLSYGIIWSMMSGSATQLEETFIDTEGILNKTGGLKSEIHGSLQASGNSQYLKHSSLLM
ncbi:hypothetical protein DSM25559_4454 [Agrobacterium rosae]|uniref:Uncharacterized protein n=1 Tax=Agrobacterium rosae TaxID=1972867 RepID=A0A1R3U0L9_9HYPH|nr:hypothetical protein DSM25559_4454 [Agrobacterium rosae]